MGRFIKRIYSSDEDSSDSGEELPVLLSEASVPATLDTQITSDSIGFQYLERFGWRQGAGLGQDGQGRVEPVRFVEQVGTLGLGRAVVEEGLLQASSKARDLASIRIAQETEQDREEREARNQARAAAKAEVAERLAKFHCDLCGKGYKNARQWEEHLNSYDHAHVKRKKEWAAEVKTAMLQSGELDRRRERERLQEATELRRMGISGFDMKAIPVDEPVASTSSGPKTFGFKKIAPVPPPLASTSDPSTLAPTGTEGGASTSTRPAIKFGGFKKITIAAPNAASALIKPAHAPTMSEASLGCLGTPSKAAKAFADDDDDEPSIPVATNSQSGKTPALPRMQFTLKRKA